MEDIFILNKEVDCDEDTFKYLSEHKAHLYGGNIDALRSACDLAKAKKGRASTSSLFFSFGDSNELFSIINSVGTLFSHLSTFGKIPQFEDTYNYVIVTNVLDWASKLTIKDKELYKRCLHMVLRRRLLIASCEHNNSSPMCTNLITYVLLLSAYL